MIDPKHDPEPVTDYARRCLNCGKDYGPGRSSRCPHEPVPVTVIACGPSSKTCKCECPDGPCGHVWDGPPRVEGTMESATCSKCGMAAIDHDLWVSP